MELINHQTIHLNHFYVKHSAQPISRLNPIIPRALGIMGRPPGSLPLATPHQGAEGRSHPQVPCAAGALHGRRAERGAGGARAAAVLGRAVKEMMFLAEDDG